MQKPKQMSNDTAFRKVQIMMNFSISTFFVGLVTKSYWTVQLAHLLHKLEGQVYQTINPADENWTNPMFKNVLLPPWCLRNRSSYTIHLQWITLYTMFWSIQLFVSVTQLKVFTFSISMSSLKFSLFLHHCPYCCMHVQACFCICTGHKQVTKRHISSNIYQFTETR